MVTILDSDMKLLPLEYYLLSNQIALPKSKPILLSRFKNLDYELLEKLERSKIYDTGDLELIPDDLLQSLGLSKNGCTKLRNSISKEIHRFSKLPHLLLDLPENFGLIFYMKNEENFVFELFWRGLSFWWSVTEDKLESFIVELLKFLHSIGLPELISFANKLPELDMLELPVFDISIYFGNIDTSASIDQMLELLELKGSKDTLFKFSETLVLAYLIKLVM